MKELVKNIIEKYAEHIELVGEKRVHAKALRR